MNHQEKADGGPTEAEDHIDDDVGNGLAGLSVTEGGECVHRECGERGQRAEKALANEVMPRDEGNGSHLDCPYEQSHDERAKHVYKQGAVGKTFAEPRGEPRGNLEAAVSAERASARHPKRSGQFSHSVSFWKRPGSWPGL